LLDSLLQEIKQKNFKDEGDFNPVFVPTH